MFRNALLEYWQGVFFWGDMAILFNPEDNWERPHATLGDEREAVELRVGPFDGELCTLKGGLANWNILMGPSRVLRIYRQDAGRLGKERALLEMAWKNFEVPEVLGDGDDFLLLSHVKHQPLEDSSQQGLAVGMALAEIHGHRFETAGFLDSGLKVVEPFGDLLGSLMEYSQACLGEPGLEDLKEDLRVFLDARIEILRQKVGPPLLVHSDFKISNVHWTVSGKPLILDWETAYAGSALSDIGQLFRWGSSAEFAGAFELGYRTQGGHLVEGWRAWSEVFDQMNLASLLRDSEPASKRRRDVAGRIHDTLSKA